MFTTMVETNNEKLFICKTEEKSLELQECEVKNNEIEIDASNILTIKNQDGTETNYIPYYENGQIIMTPITLDDIDEDEKTDVITLCSEKDEAINLELKCENDQSVKHKLPTEMFDEKEHKFIKYGDEVLRPIPAIDSTSKKSARVAPNTYKNSLIKIDNGSENLIRIGRKHVIVDQKTIISAKSFKQQLLNTDDLIKKRELAPKTKKKMRHMVDGYTKLFAYPAHASLSQKLRDLYTRHCTTRKQPNYENLDDMVLLPVGYQVDVDRSSLKRISRRRKYPEVEEHKQKEIVTLSNNSAKNIETNLKCMEIDIENHNSIKVLLEAASHSSKSKQLINNKQQEITDNIKETQIVVIQNSSTNNDNTNENEVAQDGIEVLLAAAESRDDSCNEEKNYEIIVADDNDSEVNMNEAILSNDSIIIVHNNGHYFIHNNIGSVLP